MMRHLRSDAATIRRLDGIFRPWILVALVVIVVVVAALAPLYRERQGLATAQRVLNSLDRSKLPPERRQDLDRIVAAFEATQGEPLSLARRNNAAVLLWMLRERSEAQRLMSLAAATATDNHDGIRLNQELVSEEPQNDWLPSSKLVAVQRTLNQARQRLYADASYEPAELLAVAEDAGLPYRLRAKASCLLGLQKVASGAAVADGLSYFEQATDLDPQGPIGQIAMENMARLRSMRLDSAPR